MHFYHKADEGRDHARSGSFATVRVGSPPSSRLRRRKIQVLLDRFLSFLACVCTSCRSTKWINKLSRPFNGIRVIFTVSTSRSVRWFSKQCDFNGQICVSVRVCSPQTFLNASESSQCTLAYAYISFKKNCLSVKLNIIKMLQMNIVCSATINTACSQASEKECQFAGLCAEIEISIRRNTTKGTTLQTEFSRFLLVHSTRPTRFLDMWDLTVPR